VGLITDTLPKALVFVGSFQLHISSKRKGQIQQNRLPLLKYVITTFSML